MYGVACNTLYVNTSVVLGLFFLFIGHYRLLYGCGAALHPCCWVGGDMCLAHLVTGRADNATIYVLLCGVYTAGTRRGTLLHEGSLGSSRSVLCNECFSNEVV